MRLYQAIYRERVRGREFGSRGLAVHSASYHDGPRGAPRVYVRVFGGNVSVKVSRPTHHKRARERERERERERTAVCAAADGGARHPGKRAQKGGIGARREGRGRTGLGPRQTASASAAAALCAPCIVVGTSVLCRELAGASRSCEPSLVELSIRRVCVLLSVRIYLWRKKKTFGYRGWDSAPLLAI